MCRSTGDTFPDLQNLGCRQGHVVHKVGEEREEPPSWRALLSLHTSSGALWQA